jgi:hypothetical protein
LAHANSPEISNNIFFYIHKVKAEERIKLAQYALSLKLPTQVFPGCQAFGRALNRALNLDSQEGRCYFFYKNNGCS